MATLIADESFGSIKEQYQLMINPQPQRLVLLLKYPNRQPWELYSDECGKRPLELRIKPKCGLVEVDIPIDTHYHYDREKGVEFGSALRKTAVHGNSNSFYGLSSGLDARTSKKREDDPAALEEPSREKLLEDFDDANGEGYVMNRITLGGRIEPFKEGDPLYMLATFDEDTSTWTPLDGMVMLRPQFEHLDALRVQQRMGSRSTRPDEDNRKESKAEDVNMTVKDTEDDEPQDDLYGGMAETLKTLRAMAEEPWQRLGWVDSEDDRAYAMWEGTLVFQNAETAPKLVSNMAPETYLDAISCPRVDPIHKGRNIMRPLDADPDDFGLTTDEDQHQPISRPKDLETKYLIEGTCREICGKSEGDHEQITKFVRRHFKSDPRYAFLRKSHPLHPFFMWRLRRNKAKRGWSLKLLCETEDSGERGAGQMKAAGFKGVPDTTRIRRESNDVEGAAVGEAMIPSSKPSSRKGKNPRGRSGMRKSLG